MLLLLFLLMGTGAAQIDGPFADMGRRVRVRVVFAKPAACDSSIRVVLTRNMGLGVEQGSINSDCVAEFSDVPAGRYRVSVMGRGVANADDGEIEISPVIAQEVEIRALRTGGFDPLQGGAASAFVSVSDLGVPSGAAKDFEKAGRLIAKQNWTKAADELHKAVAAYPAYAAAYNNLGVVYSRMGNSAQARAALQKAISINDHLASAYVNLSRISIKSDDFPGAESLLSKAASLGPADAVTFSLLAYAQLMDQHLDQALDTCRQAHAAQPGQHVFLHLVAAHAYELKGNTAASIAELQTYLHEDPASPQVDEVRKALATLQAQAASTETGARAGSQ
jgi:Tfp pilus assembly protein PilF